MEERIGGGQIFAHLVLVPQAALGDHRVGHRDENAAADVPGEVNETGDLVVFLRGDTEVRRGGHGNEYERNREHLNYSDNRGEVEADAQVQILRDKVIGQRKQQKSKDDQVSRWEAAYRLPREREGNN